MNYMEKKMEDQGMFRTLENMSAAEVAPQGSGADAFDSSAAQNNELRAAAAAVVARWDSPKWKDEKSTADFIARLRQALQSSGISGELANKQIFENIEELQPSGNSGEFGAPSEAMISAAARALANRSADVCNVDREDNWKVYSNVFIEDARAALTAAGAA
jgi:hypothetical protein